jgi:hypothetical protein
VAIALTIPQCLGKKKNPREVISVSTTERHESGGSRARSVESGDGQVTHFI